jgi:hypothetical protein
LQSNPDPQAQQTETEIPTRSMESFYPIYAVAQNTFGVNWLLIGSIHRQESAFSTDPTTYRGLNFAACCGGPMQFNVTNGPVSTWDLVSDSYRYGRRPGGYDHMTTTHPSLYDDFDSIMAAAHLLSADGAGLALDGAAWVPPTTTTGTTLPGWPTPIRCWHARSAGHSTASASTAASTQRWSELCTQPTVRPCSRPRRARELRLSAADRSSHQRVTEIQDVARKLFQARHARPARSVALRELAQLTGNPVEHVTVFRLIEVFA